MPPHQRDSDMALMYGPHPAGSAMHGPHPSGTWAPPSRLSAMHGPHLAGSQLSRRHFREGDSAIPPGSWAMCAPCRYPCRP